MILLIQRKKEESWKDRGRADAALRDWLEKGPIAPSPMNLFTPQAMPVAVADGQAKNSSG